MGRALAGHFAIANWPLGILSEMALLMYCTFNHVTMFENSNQTPVCGEYDCVVLPPKRLGSSPNVAAEVFFHSERSGHVEVGWSQPKQGSGTVQGSSVKNCMDGISSNGFQWFSQGEICRSFIFPQQQNIAMGSLAQISSGAIRCSFNTRFRTRFRKFPVQIPREVPEGSGEDTC